MRLKKSAELIKNEQEREDVGFGTKITGKSTRLVNRDGNFNVKRIGQQFHDWLNLYNRLIVMSWGRFGLMIFLIFLGANLIFACLYYLIGTNHLMGIIAKSPLDHFTESFFFRYKRSPQLVMGE